MSNLVDKAKMAEVQLCEIFGVQVPPTTPKHIKARLFTIAARVNAEKVIDNPDISALLDLVGAISPVKIKATGEFQCFGVLWMKDNIVCSSCGMQSQCQNIAMNYGLHHIKIDPKLLGAKSKRTLWNVGTYSPEQEVSGKELRVVAQSERDEELLAFLNEHFRALLREDEIFYQVPEASHLKSGVTLYQFCVGRPDSLMELRFCNPADSLKPKLFNKTGKAGNRLGVWVLPPNATTKAAIDLINEHVFNVMKQL